MRAILPSGPKGGALPLTGVVGGVGLALGAQPLALLAPRLQFLTADLALEQAAPGVGGAAARGMGHGGGKFVCGDRFDGAIKKDGARKKECG